MRFLVTVLLVGLLFGCSKSPEGPPSILSKDARVPSDEGIVTSVTFESLTMEGKRTYTISKAVESFTTSSHATTPIRHWLNRYVHLGLNDKKEIVWVAGIGLVPQGVENPRVVYSGVFRKLDSSGRAEFEDGTVLRLADGVTPPAGGVRVVATIDPVARRVISLSEAGTG